MAARHLAFANTYQTKPQDYQDANSTQCVAEPAAAIVARLEAAFRTALSDENFKREAARQFMPLNTMVGAEYRAFAQRVDDRLKQLWQVRPWRG